jgi:hypothetical protein
MKMMEKIEHSEVLKKTLLVAAIVMVLVGCGSSTTTTTPINLTAIGPVGEIETAEIVGESSGEELTNEATTTIVVQTDSTAAMYSDIDNTTLINDGEIIINGTESGGVVLESSYSEGINNGGITVNGSNGAGMIGDGIGTTITNEADGTINIVGNNGYGMAVSNGATAINEGTINIDGMNGVGMYAEGDGSTIENNGTIYLPGTVTGSYLTDGQTALTESISNGSDDDNNTGMKIVNGATMINRGQIVTVPE